MKKLVLSSLILTAFAMVIVLFQISGCNKTTVQPAPVACDVTGIYTGTSVDNGVSAPITYNLRANDFATGSVTPNGPVVTFGSYTNTCDSVKLTVYYSANSDYYVLQGKLLNNQTTISGTFKNLTLVSDSGTFSIMK